MADLQIGGWQLKKRLGKGGNGEVYLAERAEIVGAMKLLSASITRPDRIARFSDEVQAMRACANIPGVLPILDADMAPPTGQRPWFVMGLATPLVEALAENPSLAKVVGAVRDIAIALQAMHARNFSHRDIKPDNLFFAQGSWSVGDFGLVSFEGKSSETAAGERIGPIYFIAPEMLNTAVNADGRPADVFSLAKTLWVLATGQRFPLPGAYDTGHEAFRIGSYIAAERTQALDRLIAKATSFAPANRPTMSQFVAELSAWLQPVQRPASTLTFSVGDHAIELARRKAASEAERDHQQRIVIRSEEIGRRLREEHRPFANEIAEALKSLDVFEAVHLEIDHVQWGFHLTANIPGGPSEGAASVLLRFWFSPMDEHVVQAGAYVELDIRAGAPFRATVWDKTVEFLEGGSEEPILLGQLREGVRQEFQRAVTKAVEVSIAGRATVGHPWVYRFEITDAEGLPIGNAEILFVAGDGVFLRAKTGLEGIATLGPTPLIDVVVLISHARCRAHNFIMPIAQTSFRIVLQESSSGGSMVCTGGWTQVQGLHGQISLIHDSNGRTYAYGQNVAIDGGKTQPVTIALGKATRLQGADGTQISFIPRAIRGQCFLLDVDKAGSNSDS